MERITIFLDPNAPEATNSFANMLLKEDKSEILSATRDNIKVFLEENDLDTATKIVYLGDKEEICSLINSNFEVYNSVSLSTGDLNNLTVINNLNSFKPRRALGEIRKLIRWGLIDSNDILKSYTKN